MAKRVYFETVKRWLVAIGASSVPIAAGLLAYLVFTGAIVIDSHSGDFACAGTPANPCIAEITFHANEDVFIYPEDYYPWKKTNGVATDFKPALASWEMYREWGDSWRKIPLETGCTGSWCGCGYCTKDNPSKFAYAFRKGKNYTVQIRGLKENPADEIKWTVGPLDPIFSSVKMTDIVKESSVVEEPDKICAYRTICNPTDLLYNERLYPIKEDLGTKTIDLGFEVKELRTTDRIVVSEKCVIEEGYNASSKFLQNISICIPIEKKVPYIDTVWVSGDSYNWESKQCYETRQCIQRKNKLDPITTEIHVPMLGYDLKEFTTITASGYNQTIINFSNADSYTSMEALDTGSAPIDSTRHKTITNNNAVTFTAGGKYINQSNYLAASKKNLEIVGSVIPPNSTYRVWVNNGGGSGSREMVIATSNSDGNDDFFFVEKNSDNTFRAFIETPSGAGCTVSSGAYADNDWHHVVIKRAGVELTLYVDGVDKGSCNDNAGGAETIPEEMHIGILATTLGAIPANVITIGEVGGFNGSWSDAKVVLDYNSNNGTFYEVFGPYNASGSFQLVNLTSDCMGVNNYINISTNKTGFITKTATDSHDFGDQQSGFYLNIDTEQCSWVLVNVTNTTGPVDNPPDVNLTSPADALSTTDTNIDFKANAADDTGLVNVSLYINNILNQTNSSGLINGSYTINVPVLAAATYNWTFEACDTNDACTIENNRTLTILATIDINLSVNGSFSNIDVELGTIITSVATITAGNVVCIRADHPDYMAPNANCGINESTLDVNITYFRTNTDNESRLTFNLSFENAPENLTFNISAHQYDEVDALRFNVTGYEGPEGDLPSGVKVYVDEDLDQTVSSLASADFFILSEFSDGDTTKTTQLEFETLTTIGNIKIPKVANVTASSIDIIGVLQQYTDKQCVFEDELTTTYDCVAEKNTKACDDDYVSVSAAGGPGGCSENMVVSLGYPDETKYLGCISRGALLDSATLWYKLIVENIAGTLTSSIYYGVDTASRGICPRCNSQAGWFDAGGCRPQDQSLTVLGAFSTGTGVWKNFDVTTEVNTSLNDTALLLFTVSDSVGNPDQLFRDIRTLYNFTYKAVPRNPLFYVNDNLTWSKDGHWYSSTVTLTNMTDFLNGFLADCTADVDGDCLIPIKIKADSLSNVTTSNIVINYSLGIAQQISLNTGRVEAFLLNQSNRTVIPIMVESSTNGSIIVNDIQYDHAGGNDTIEFTAYLNNTRASNISRNVTYYHSRWNVSFPLYVDFLEFIPKKGPTEDNVTPYGQNLANAIQSFDIWGYHAKTKNLSVIMNETFWCVNMTMNSSSTRGDSPLMLNATWTELNSSSRYLETIGVWMWADYECNYTNWFLWNPDFTFRSCCDGCVCSEESRNAEEI